MVIYPAIDLFEKKAVRLYKGDYAQMTVYSENPIEIAYDFAAQGASHLHLVDLEGAKSGETPNLSVKLPHDHFQGAKRQLKGNTRATKGD